MRTFNLNLAQGVVPDENLGGRFADGLLVQGQRQITGSFDRRYVDTAIRKRLEAGEPFTLSIEITSRQVIGSSTDPYRMQFESPQCLATGRPAVVSGAEDFPESIAFECYEDTGAGDPSDVTVTCDNAVADLTV
jgi:hypothetical protein